MELLPIFVGDATLEGLYAIKYPGEASDEFERLFNFWNDTNYIQEYFVLNKDYLQTLFFKNISIDELIDKILDEAQLLENSLYEFTAKGFDSEENNLQMLFKPLYNTEYTIPIHQKTKAKVGGRFIKNPILRIYALRIGNNTFVITGGAIKLTRAMKEHPDTIIELEKLERVKSFLEANEINIDDDLIYYYAQF